MALENFLHATFTVCLQPKINYRIYNISSVTIFIVAFANLGKKVFTVFISNRDIIISVPYLAGSICVFCFAAAVLFIVFEAYALPWVCLSRQTHHLFAHKLLWIPTCAGYVGVCCVD